MKTKLLDVLRAGGFSSVSEIVIERGDDSTGTPALFVWLLLDDSVSDKELSLQFVGPLLDTARRQMRDWEPELYPYVRVRRVREWQEMVAL